MADVGGFQPSTRTAGDVLRAVRRQFGDDAGVQITDANVFDWINDGQDTIVNRNRILKTKATTSSVIGVSQYQFPSTNIEQVESLHYAGLPLRNISFAQAEQEIRYWASNPPEQPLVWWEWAGLFTLWPAPIDVQSIDLYYTTRPTPIETAVDVLSIPDKYFQTLVQYVLQQAYELDEDWQAAQQKQQQFETNINQFGEEERTEEHMTYQTITDVEDNLFHGWEWI